MPELPADARAAAPPETRHETTKETMISIIMSFALVFVFTRFVVASYVIPTGSMAPTLMGAHMRFYSDETGAEWPINPWSFHDTQQRVPDSPQPGPIAPFDDIADVPLPPQSNVPLRSGDRIFVLNYVDKLRGPRRWDVVVFKYPGDAAENYIKRLIGLPNEEVWLADGDVFVREPASADPALRERRIQRKPARVQRDLWYTIYSSELRPLNEQHNGRAWRDRWTGDGWKAAGLALRHEAAPADGAYSLRWDATARQIDDWVDYNDTPSMRGFVRRFPVADLRLRAGVAPVGAGLRTAVTLAARAHEFQAVIDGSRAVLRMRAAPGAAVDRSAGQPPEEPAWIDLAAGVIEPLTPGKVTDVEFWHVDQSLLLYIGGNLVARGEYNWGPQERMRFTLKRAFAPGNPAIFESQYEPPRVSWTFSGAGVTLDRVGLDRDTYYQPVYGQGQLVRAGGPERSLLLGQDEYFPLGDNSAASGDGRVWSTVDPWVAFQLDDHPGVVPRELMLGKAFFVFWPSLHKGFMFPVPDFGRMRMIR